MMWNKSFFFLLCLLSLGEQCLVSSLIVLQPRRSSTITQLLATSNNKNDNILTFAELHETWNSAAALGNDAVEQIRNVLQDRALNCKQKALSRHFGLKNEGKTNISQNIDTTAVDLSSMVEKEYETAYRIAAGQSEIDFMTAIHREEEKFLEGINEILSDYNHDLSSQTNMDDDGFTEEDIFSATRQYIQRSVATDELFQIAIERAELAYKGAIIQAEETRNEEAQFYEKHGRYLQATSREDLMFLTVVQLKQRLRNNGKKVSGKKQELVDRLLLE